jgi:AAHS family 3-hydroxyphenylpropionic acid transporter
MLAPVLLRVLRESSQFEHRPNPAELTPTPSASGATLKAGSFIAIFASGRASLTVPLWISSFLELLILYLILSWLPTLLVGNGLSKAEAAAVQVAFNVGGALAALVIGQLLEGKHRNTSIVAAFAGVPVFVLLLSKTPPQLSLVMSIVFALGSAILAALGFLYATAPQCYPTLIRGVGVGTAVAVGRLGSIVGPKLGGLFKAAGHSSSRLLLDVLPLAVLGSIVALVLAWQIAKAGHTRSDAAARPKMREQDDVVE